MWSWLQSVIVPSLCFLRIAGRKATRTQVREFSEYLIRSINNIFAYAAVTKSSMWQVLVHSSSYSGCFEYHDFHFGHHCCSPGYIFCTVKNCESLLKYSRHSFDSSIILVHRWFSGLCILPLILDSYCMCRNIIGWFHWCIIVHLYTQSWLGIYNKTYAHKTRKPSLVHRRIRILTSPRKLDQSGRDEFGTQE